jgi:hypothetical protein
MEGEMVTDIRIIHAHDFIRATPEGKLDFEKSRKLLTEIASASGPLVDYNVILDTRKAHTEMSVAELWHLAAEISNVRKVFTRKTAVLCPIKEFDHAAFFALCAKNRGLKIQAFTPYEDAMEWLIAKGT